MNTLRLKLRENMELFGSAPQIDDPVFARIRGTISKIEAEQIDLGHGETINGEAFVTVLVLEVIPS